MLSRTHEQKLKQMRWYRQGGAINLFYSFGPYHCVHKTIGYDGCVIYQKGLLNTAFFARDRERARAERTIKQQVRDPQFIERWIWEWRKRIDVALAYCQREFQEPIDAWTGKKVARFLPRMNQLMLQFWMKQVLIDWFDPDGDRLLADEITRAGVTLTPDEIALCTSPEKLLIAQEEFIARVALMNALGRPSFETLLACHARAYSWIDNTFSAVFVRDVNYFRKKIRTDMRRHRVLKEEARQIISGLHARIEARKQFMKKKRLPGRLIRVFHFYRRMAEWRDARKQFAVCMMQAYLYPIVRRLAAENHLREDVAWQLLYTDVHGWRLGGETKARLQKRYRGALYFCENQEHCSWLYGKQADRVLRLLLATIARGELAGVGASAGKARGVVRLVETSADFKKMRRGDIIVASMTRPEYVPIMRLASAIITNEGGITCHAAVVSRELGIPCVIGTQSATDVLCDGDRVEVDGGSGTVRKL